MPKLRLPIPTRRGGRWLAVGVAAALVALPGVASADTGTGPVPALPSGSAPGPLDNLNQLPVPTPGGGLQTLPSLPTPQQQAGQQDTTTGASTSSSSMPAPPTLPPQLQQLLDQLPSNPGCSDAIQADITKLLTDIPNLVQAIIAELTQQLGSGSPPSPQQILSQLQGLLGTAQGQQAAASSPSPDPTVIFTDLQQLVTDLSTTCAPVPPSAPAPPSTPPSAGGQQPPSAQGVSQPTQAQPVSYPGYAPTGGIATTSLRPASDQRSSDPVPLSALGAVLLLSTAAAVGVRFRARRAGR